jgi:hypothetical protein
MRPVVELVLRRLTFGLRPSDHLDSVVTSIDQFVNTCDHLTDYIFNVGVQADPRMLPVTDVVLISATQMLSFVTNASMERLSLVTVIFLRTLAAALYDGLTELLTLARLQRLPSWPDTLA